MTNSLVPVQQIVQPPPLQMVISLSEAINILNQTHPPIDSEEINFVLYRNYSIVENPNQQDKNGKSRRNPVKWSNEEQEFLLNGYRKFSNCWTQILKEYPMHPIRIRFDLKDKWKNLLKKQSDPKIKQIFDDINECVDTRNQNLTKGVPFFILGHDSNSKDMDKDPFYQELQRIRGRIHTILPKRYQQHICKLLENKETQETVMREWLSVEANPSKAFDFLEKFTN